MISECIQCVTSHGHILMTSVIFGNGCATGDRSVSFIADVQEILNMNNNLQMEPPQMDTSWNICSMRLKKLLNLFM